MRVEPDTAPHLALIGFMGAGKTTIGRLLAERLNLPLADLDAQLVAQTGRPISDLFASDGEAAFRDRETAVLRETCGLPPRLIATGGGIVLRPENRDLLRRSAFVVWLTARPDIVALRVGSGHTRPVLTGGEPEPLPVRILRLLGERGPLYQQTAHAIVDTSDRATHSVTSEIIRKWERWREEQKAAPAGVGASGRPPSPGPSPHRMGGGEQEYHSLPLSRTEEHYYSPPPIRWGEGPGEGGLLNVLRPGEGGHSAATTPGEASLPTGTSDATGSRP